MNNLLQSKPIKNTGVPGSSVAQKKPLKASGKGKGIVSESEKGADQKDQEDVISQLGDGGAEENRGPPNLPNTHEDASTSQEQILAQWEADIKYQAVTTTLSNQKIILQGWISAMTTTMKTTARRIGALKGNKSDLRTEAATGRLIYEALLKIMESDRGFKTMVIYDIFPAMNELMLKQINARLTYIGIALSSRSQLPGEVIESEEMLDLRRKQAIEQYYDNEVLPALQKTKEFLALTAEAKAEYTDSGAEYMLTLSKWSPLADLYKAQLRRKVIIPIEKKRLADLERQSAQRQLSQEALRSEADLTRERDMLTGMIIAAEAYKTFHTSLLDEIMVLISDSPGLALRARNQILNPATGVHIASVTNPPNICAAYYMLLHRRDAGIGGFQSAVIDIIMATNADHKAILLRPSLAAEEMQAHLKTWIEQDYCRRYCTTDVLMCIGLIQMLPFGTKLHADVYDEFIDVYEEYTTEGDSSRQAGGEARGSGSVLSSAGQGISRFETPMFLRLNAFLSKCSEKKDGLAEMVKAGSKSLATSQPSDIITDRTHDARSAGIVEQTAGGHPFPPPSGEQNIWSHHTKIDKMSASQIAPADRKYIVTHGKKTSYTATPAPCPICASSEPSKRGHGTSVWCRPMQCTKCKLYGHANTWCMQTK